MQLRSEALHAAVKIFFGDCAPRPRLVVEGEGRHSTRCEKCEECEGEIGKGEQGASDALTQTCCCLTEPLSHGTLRRITPKTAAWARDRADIFPATYTYGWVRTEHRLTHSDRLQSTQAVDLQTHEAPVCSRCESAAALRRRDVCRVRARVARVTAAHVLQCFADAVDTLHSDSRSCNHRSSSVRCLWHRQARRSESRACEARGSVDIS